MITPDLWTLSSASWASILTDLFQRLLAQDILCLAGILGGDVLVHAQLLKNG